MMAKSIDQQIKDAMAKKVVGRTTEIYKAVVLELYKCITANSLQVNIAYGSPVLTGRYYASYTIAWGRIDTTVRDPNPDGEEHPYPGLPLTNAAAALVGFKLGETTDIANSLPYAQVLEDGHSKFKAPEGIYGVAAQQIAQKFKGATKITLSGLKWRLSSTAPRLSSHGSIRNGPQRTPVFPSSTTISITSL
jgi:hypothetical protein